MFINNCKGYYTRRMIPAAGMSVATMRLYIISLCPMPMCLHQCWVTVDGLAFPLLIISFQTKSLGLRFGLSSIMLIFINHQVAVWGRIQSDAGILVTI